MCSGATPGAVELGSREEVEFSQHKYHPARERDLLRFDGDVAISGCRQTSCCNKGGQVVDNLLNQNFEQRAFDVKADVSHIMAEVHPPAFGNIHIVVYQIIQAIACDVFPVAEHSVHFSHKILS